MQFFFNFNLEDKYFLKLLAVQKKKHGQPYYGVNYQFYSTKLSGSKSINSGVTAHQNSFMPLQLPYSLIGIGRSNNFIEHLTIKYPLFNIKNKKKYSPIIPNSQLVIKAHEGKASK